MWEKRGAEALLRRLHWHGREAVEKHRLPKSYRHTQLDESLRRYRIRMETRLMSEARRAGVPVPTIYDIDPWENRIIMEFIEGPTVKEAISSRSCDSEALCERIGELVASMHLRDVIHGDLTTSNMILRGGRIYFVDLSLGERSSSIESKGVDLHLLKEALNSAHSDNPDLYEAVVRGYARHVPYADSVLAKVKQIEERGRYT